MADKNSAKYQNIMTALWVILLIAGIIGWILVSGFSDEIWRALLVNFLYFTSLAAGLTLWSAVVRLSNGNWMGELEKLTTAGIAFAPISLIALVILWWSSPQWAPWLHHETHHGIWLNNTFLFARNMIMLALFWIIAIVFHSQGRKKVWASVLILTYVVTFSLLGFDLVMALDPHWYSSLFGAYFFISPLYIGVAAWALQAVFTQSPDRNRLHDLGKLLLAFSMLTTYMMFSQMYVIWYGNIPHETRYLVPRMNYQPWMWVSYFLLGVIYLGPLLFLLTRWAKRTPWFLGLVAAVILLGMWIERWWLVEPTFNRDSMSAIPEIFIAAIFLGSLGILFTLFYRKPPKFAAKGIEGQ